MVSKKVAKDKKEKAALTSVRLTQKHGIVEPGEYQVESYNSDGDPILITNNGKGRITVPLDKVEVIKPGTKVKDAPATERSAKAKKDLKQIEMLKDDKDFYIDPYGQMTINRIDTPLGKLAQRLIQAGLEIQKLEDQMIEDEDVMMKEMKKNNVTKITVLGHRLVYQESRTTNAKLIIKDLE